MKEASYDNDALDWRNICQTFSHFPQYHLGIFVVDPVSMLKWLDIGTRAKKSWGSHSRGGIHYFCANRRCLMCKSYRLKLHQLHQLQRLHPCQIQIQTLIQILIHLHLNNRTTSRNASHQSDITLYNGEHPCALDLKFRDTILVNNLLGAKETPHSCLP